MEGNSKKGRALGALDRLQTSLRERKVDFRRWERDLKAERRAAAQRLSSKRGETSKSVSAFSR